MMRAGSRRIGERFPHVRTGAEDLYERDEVFRELCEEYEACAEAEERMEASGPEHEPMRREYAALLLRLEAEMLRYLQDHPSL